MRILSTISLSLLLICSFGCEKPAPIEAKSFEVKSFLLRIQRKNAVLPCNTYSLTIEPDGKFFAERSCSTTADFSKCRTYEANGVSVKARHCVNQETEKIEKQLSHETIKELIEEIKKSNFFSFEDDYSYNSKNCPTPATDSPGAILTIKFNETEKTIDHYHGCYVSNQFSQGNLLQPLTDLEYKIYEIIRIESWTSGQK